MKVYLVRYYIPYEDWKIMGIYKDKKEAEKKSDDLNKENKWDKYTEYGVEEWEVL